MPDDTDEHRETGETGEEDRDRHPTRDPAAGTSRTEALFETALGASRMLVVIPVVVLLVAALGAFVYGAAVFVADVHVVVVHPLPVGKKIGLFLVEIDLFLIGATLLIAAIGFYELFISRVDTGRFRRLPAWLEMRDLNDLKARVIAMLVLVASVSFVELVVDVERATRVLEVGGGVAVVILALTAFLRFGSPAGPRRQ
ncbi:MAG TPA: YqhA family protein [Acidimicrobiales bacterium]|nr:YqhA family protein [Acidimicrobiales bacterium]